MINRKKILIVGGTGELGQYLSNIFSKQNNEVCVAGRKFSSEKLSPDVKFFKTDIFLLRVKIFCKLNSGKKKIKDQKKYKKLCINFFTLNNKKK